MLPSQRRLQSVCAVWQRVLQVCTLALAVAHMNTQHRSNEKPNRALTLSERPRPKLDPFSLQRLRRPSLLNPHPPLRPSAARVPPSCNFMLPYGSTIGSLSQKRVAGDHSLRLSGSDLLNPFPRRIGFQLKSWNFVWRPLQMSL
jgi:hypothetical protein